MKTKLLIFAAIVACLCACSIQEVEPVSVGTGLEFDVTVNSTKAVKTAWEVGDMIYVFFDESATTGATGDNDLNYLVLTYSSSAKWEGSFHQPGTDMETYLRGRSGGKFDAIYSPYGDASVSGSPYSEGPYIVRSGCSYFLTQLQQKYTVSGNVVTMTITLAAPYNDVTQVYVDGLAQTSSTDWKLTCTDESGNGGLTRFDGAIYDPEAHSFTRHCADGPSDASIDGYAMGGGTVFYGIASEVTGDLTLTLTDAKSGSSASSFVKTGVSGVPRAVSVSVEDFFGPDAYRTVLYTDGTLIIDEPGCRRSANTAIHGEAIKVMDAWHTNASAYSLAGASKQPWYSVKDKILSIEFGSEVQPVNTKYWFYNCTALSSFDATGLDMSQCTAMGMMFGAVGKSSSETFDLDLSSFDLSSLSGTTALQSVFQNATGIKSLDISGWRIPSGATNCNNMFNGCTSLQRIYVDEGVDFSSVTNSTNMFRNCSSISGGNWTTLDETFLDKTYARVDTYGQEGYFTLKDADPGYVNPGYWATEKPTNVDSSLVGYTQSGFNVSQCIYTDDSRNQYVGYYDGNHDMVIAQRKLPYGPWRYCKVGQTVGWDSHNSITMIKDKAGRLHVSGNMHVSSLVFYSTDETGDISRLSAVTSLVGKDEINMTYPKFIQLADGRILYHYRVGSSGNGDEIYDILEDDGKWYRFLDTPLTDGENQRNAYFIDAVQGPDGWYHVAYVWRETYLAETNHDLCYLKTPDFKNWYAADGTKMTLPVKSSDKEALVDPIPQSGGCLNGGQQIGFDADGRPIIIYYKYDDNGYSQIYAARFEGSSWHISQLTNSTWRWSFGGGGSITKRITIAAPVAEADGSITVIYHFIYESATQLNSEIWIDGDSLEAEYEATPRSQPSRYGSWVKKIYTPYTGAGTLGVKMSYDITGKAYMLRWESLGNFNDMKPWVEIPPASELRVVKLNY